METTNNNNKQQQDCKDLSIVRQLISSQPELTFLYRKTLIGKHLLQNLSSRQRQRQRQRLKQRQRQRRSQRQRQKRHAQLSFSFSVVCPLFIFSFIKGDTMWPQYINWVFQHPCLYLHLSIYLAHNLSLKIYLLKSIFTHNI